MRAFRKILMALAATAVLLIAVGFLLPATAHVERSTVIDAPTCTVFTLVNGFKSFNQWSPWFELDPNARYTFHGPEYGAGSRVSWVSDNPNVGSGSQTVTGSEPNKTVLLALDFGPQGAAKAFFNLNSEGPTTRVTWGFDTDFGYNLFSRYFGLFFNSMIGADFEKGLAGLKRLAEGLPRADWCSLDIALVETVPMTIAYTAGKSSSDTVEIGKALAAAYAEIGRFMARYGLNETSNPVCITRSRTEQEYLFEAGIPVDSVPARETSADSPVKIGTTFSGKAVRAVHRGSYGSLPETHAKVEAYIAAHGMKEGEGPWEQYVSDPGNTPEADLITNVYHPVK
jgi:effector-binding domain-containing protein